METWTVKRILDWMEGYLAEHGDENPRLSAQWLLADTLSCSRIDLYTSLDRPVSQEERNTLREYTKRRANGEPLQYITGTTGFRFITLAVEPGVLIPRPETEVLVSEALAALDIESDADMLAVDLCTGSGNIACAIAHEVPCAHVYATDISPEACALAQRNVDMLGLCGRVTVVQGDLAMSLPEELWGQVQLLIANPPYIPTSELSSLAAEVSDYEPELALDGGEDGLDVLRRILLFAVDILCTRGVFAVELHETCLDAAAQLAQDAGLKDIRIVCDLAGKPRVLVARKAD